MFVIGELSPMSDVGNLKSVCPHLSNSEGHTCDHILNLVLDARDSAQIFFFDDREYRIGELAVEIVLGGESAISFSDPSHHRFQRFPEDRLAAVLRPVKEQIG